MEMDDEVVDQVDAVIAALQKYKDKVPEISPPKWYGYSPEPIPADDIETRLKGNFENSPETKEIISPEDEPGTQGYTLNVGFLYSVRIPRNLMKIYKILVKKTF